MNSYCKWRSSSHAHIPIYMYVSPDTIPLTSIMKYASKV